MGDKSGSFVLFGGFAALIIIVLLLISGSGTNSPLDRSAIGTSGLVAWLKANDQQVVEAHRRVAMSEEDVDLRILPLFDTDLYEIELPAISRAAQLRQTTQRDIEYYIIEQKMDFAPTLLMLPKWRTGVVMLGVADESLLIPMADMDELSEQILFSSPALVRPDVKLLESRTIETGAAVTLYRPQLFRNETAGGLCRPVLSIPEGVLVMACGEDGWARMYLSDPDLMNNHGLTLGANSAVALDVIARTRLGTEGALYHDTSDDILLTWRDADREVEERPRTTEDVSRYFEYPFTLIWLATALVLLVAGWRGLVRFGPPIKAFTDGIGASKTASIAAKAYLLRLTGQDHALLAEYADNKLNDLSRDLYGKGVGKDRRALFNRLTKIAPKSAGDLMDATNRMITTTSETPAAELSRIMQEFDLSYRSISDELGRISRTR